MVRSAIRHTAAIALTAGLALAAAAPAAQAVSVFTVNLTADQEVPPSGAPGSGSGRLELLGDAVNGFRLFYDLLFSADFDFGEPTAEPLSVRGLHIHAAPRGVNGGIVYGMIAPNSNLGDGEPTIVALGDGRTRVTGNWNQEEGNAGHTLATFLLATEGIRPGEEAPFYVNLHTVAYPAGAIRGQIAAVPLPASAALLAGGLLVLVRLRRT